MGLESPVSQLKAVPSSDMGNARASAAPKLAGEPIFAPMDERQLAQWELMTDQLLSGDQARPWHVRHARKLIGGAAVLVVAGLAFFSYSAWRLPAVPAVPAAPIPVTVLPESAPVPAAAPAPVAAPAPARATVPARSTIPPVSTPAPAVEPAPVAPRATITRASPAVAPVVPPSPSTGPRIPPVTHTLRDDPTPAAAAAAAVAAPAPAVAAPPVAAPGDCPDAIVALGLCTSQARKGMK
jgi:hypothetical protein